MADEPKPILIFPENSQSDEKRASRKGRDPADLYDHQEQGKRFKSDFDTLRNTLKRINKGETPDDDGDIILPDRVLVLETKAPVEAFWKALNKIDGLDGLAEWLRPARSTETEAERRKGRLYLALPSQEGLKELERAWRRYQNNQSLPRGYGPLNQVFGHLEALRRWGIQDRITPEARAYFENQLDLIARGEIDDGIGIEIELWPYASGAKWSGAFRDVKKLIQKTGGARIVTQCRIDGAYVGVILAVVPADLLRKLLDANTIAVIERADLKALADANPIQAFGPRGQMLEAPPEDDEAPASSPSAGPSYPPNPDDLPGPSLDRYDVAVLDTDQQGEHGWLRRHLTIEDPHGLAGIAAELTRHGTAMASLAIHGDLTQPTPLAGRLASVPVMEGVEQGGRGVGQLRHNDIMADVLHIAIRHLFEGDKQHGPAFPDVKVISLSIGDRNRPFLGRMSAAARVLDYLAHQYGVLILVAAGNYAEDIILPLSQDDFDKISLAEQRRAILDHLRERAADEENPAPPTILAPAEAMNVLTVGALDDDPTPDQRIGSCRQYVMRADAAHHAAHHAAYSRIGPGREGQIKPDILFPGGSPLYIKQGDQNHTRLTIRPSQKFGTWQAQPHRPMENPLSRTVGTSGATASAANAAGRIVAMLRDLKDPEPVPEEHLGVLTKALMVHGCQETSWYSEAAQFHLRSNPNSLAKHEDLARFFGHGVPDVERILACTESRATVLGFGTLPPHKDAAKSFEFPIPGNLNGQALLRRVTVTLAWFAPCDGRRIAYRRARLELSLDAKDAGLTSDRKGPTRGHGKHLDTKGTIIHQVYEGDKAATLSQNAILPIKVQRASTSTLPATEKLHFGLAVTLDLGVRTGQSLPIYNEVATRLGVSPRVQPRPAGR